MSITAIALILVAACRGEKVPRDYQNEPPAMTHPVTSSSDTPSAHGMPGAAPEPSTAAEGKTSGKPVSPIPRPEKPGNQAPTTTQTTATAQTGTHLAARP